MRAHRSCASSQLIQKLGAIPAVKATVLMSTKNSSDISTFGGGVVTLTHSSTVPAPSDTETEVGRSSARTPAEGVRQ